MQVMNMFIYHSRIFTSMHAVRRWCIRNHWFYFENEVEGHYVPVGVLNQCGGPQAYIRESYKRAWYNPRNQI